MTVSLPILTHSSMSAFKRCRKLYWYRYVKRLRPAVDAMALRFGTAMHEAIDKYQRDEHATDILNWLRSLDFGDAYTSRTLSALFWGYVVRYTGCEIVAKVLHSETSFDVPLVNPETEAESRTFSLAGKRDAIVLKTDGAIALKETKTTGESIDGNRYWGRLLMDPQISLYWIMTEHEGIKVDTVVYDVIRKPAMKPERATPEDKIRIKKDGTPYANVRLTDESPDDWERRLYEDINSRPDFYFGRREIPRLEADLDAFRREVWDVAQDITSAERNDGWYRNVSRFNCDDCAYFNLCAGLEVYDGETPPPGMVVVSDPHPELRETR